MHYASRLSKEFNVIALAVCGESHEGSQISTYLHPKGAEQPKLLQSKTGQAIEKLIPWADYIEHATFDSSVQRLRANELMSFARELHDFMRDHCKLTESEKPLMVSGTLIALRNKAFAKSFDEHSPSDLQDEWLQVITKEIHRAEIPKAKKDKMVQPYSTIAAHPELGKSTKPYPKGVLHELISRLNAKVWPFISVYHDFDVVGQFYGEFLKYTGGDKKALGIVLTPRHITELFALLANVSKQSRVLDICAGTGGFLISAMHQMMKSAVTELEKERIRQKGLVGVEQQPNMFALAASNMILRGDGKANLYQGSCFEDEIVESVKAHKCSVGMLNPPFSQGDKDLHELRFIKQMLDCLGKGAFGIALAPMSCAISSHPARHEILQKHTLEAVMSVSDELFYPVGAIACIMVFTANIPHATSNKKTWFGYWKNDGFIKTKHRGRVDPAGQWPKIRNQWVEMFRNREAHPGLSVMQQVSADDEWCAEAYMETDYSKLAKEEFDHAIRKYAVFKLSNNGETGGDNPDTTNWQPFSLAALFDLKKGRRLTKANMIDGAVPFIGAIDSNNGVTAFVSQEAIHPGNTITVNYNGNGVAEAFYQPIPFRCSDDVNVLYPKFKLTPAIALFLATVIRQEKYRFSYGRKWHLERMGQSVIRLPAKPNNEPDWDFMEAYIRTFPFGSQI